MVKFYNYECSVKYRKEVTRLTRIFLNEDEIKVPKGMCIDHIFPVSLSFDMGIPPELVSDPKNIQFISKSENSKKNNKCESIPLFMQHWMIGHCMELRKTDSNTNRLKGIERAKKNGIYGGRKKGTSENIEKFLSKPKNNQASEYLKQGLRGAHICKIIDINPNTISKIKKILKEIGEL